MEIQEHSITISRAREWWKQAQSRETYSSVEEQLACNIVVRLSSLRQCGKFEYQVRGEILRNYRHVELRGQKPLVDANCERYREIDDTLEFSLLDQYQ
jgi:hypothetical protein